MEAHHVCIGDDDALLRVQHKPPRETLLQQFSLYSLRALTTCALVMMMRCCVSSTNAEPLLLRCGHFCHGCA
jgi:hypothetical protein